MNIRSNFKTRFILFTAILIFSIGCKCCAGIIDNGNFIITNVLRSENVAIITNADSVKAWRTLGSVKREQYEYKREHRINPGFSAEPEDYFVKSGEPVLVSTNLASQLSALLLDTNTLSGGAKRCGPEPGVVVTFSQGTRSVDLFFCFECEILVVNNMNEQYDFDPGCPAILKIMKKIFPKDREIQSLACE